ncbi:MAG TPA: nucleotidyltransferase [Proteiniclasticum sp.]|uniref:nucleotidyltransferase n=1 Tax=Proteiniclasticum sp. TaxID=2053595 RepID=UPI000E9C572F|nr:nucleotidyltransferase [Proteiniclasticum sp.]HBW12456.1 nucleotidyltransferase [Proteiniclasticum sp.]
MNIAAIISEYNPFHKGHAYQIEKTREAAGATHIIALMSGNFVQRGLPAIVDKYRRAEMALLGGADLVLELPVVYALSSAEFFAEGSVRILNSLHGVDLLSFGSEEGELSKLERIAKILAMEPYEYQNILKKHLSEGYSFPKARNEALMELLPDISMDFIQSPNNILGIEYIKAIYRTDSAVKPFTVKRMGKGYHDEDLEDQVFASATALRKTIYQNIPLQGHVPEPVDQYMKQLSQERYPYVALDDFIDLVKYRLITNGHTLSNIPEANEGLDQRIREVFRRCTFDSMDQYIDEIKTKRYTRTRISRILLQFLLGMDSYALQSLRKETPPSVKILASNELGKEILASLRKKKEIELQHNFGRTLNPYQELDLKASEVYGLRNTSYSFSWDFKGYPF